MILLPLRPLKTNQNNNKYGINDDLHANSFGNLGLIYMLFKKSWVMKQDAGDGKMKEISDHIYEGALAFLNAEYKLLAIFVYS